MATTPPPFSRFEWMIAWRYLRARRAEGGVSVMTWISLIGITLAVFALVATLAVREGLRSDIVGTMLGANPHIEVHYRRDFSGEVPKDHLIRDYAALQGRLERLPGVAGAAPLVRAQVMGSYRGRNQPVDVYGIAAEDLADYPMIAAPEAADGDLSRFGERVVFEGLDFRVRKGERVALIGPSGVGKTSLLRMIHGVIHPEGGRVHTLGRDMSQLRGRQLRELRRQVGMLYQADNLVAPLRVAHNVLMGRLGTWSWPRALLSLVWPQELETASAALRRVASRWTEPTSPPSHRGQPASLVVNLRPDRAALEERVSALERAGSQATARIAGLERRTRGAIGSLTSRSNRSENEQRQLLRDLNALRDDLCDRLVALEKRIAPPPRVWSRQHNAIRTLRADVAALEQEARARDKRLEKARSALTATIALTGALALDRISDHAAPVWGGAAGGPSAVVGANGEHTLQRLLELLHDTG